ncbi:unnamed protein product, partial [Brenthis ino]
MSSHTHFSPWCGTDVVCSEVAAILQTLCAWSDTVPLRFAWVCIRRPPSWLPLGARSLLATIWVCNVITDLLKTDVAVALPTAC